MNIEKKQSCKLEVCNFIKKETSVQLFSCEFCKAILDSYFIEHLQMTASE